MHVAVAIFQIIMVLLGDLACITKALEFIQCVTHGCRLLAKMKLAVLVWHRRLVVMVNWFALWLAFGN